jgi:hypothetical protein
MIDLNSYGYKKLSEKYEVISDPKSTSGGGYGTVCYENIL